MKTRKKGIVILCASLVAAIVMISIAASIKPITRAAETNSLTSKYPKIDINSITFEGDNPAEITGEASTAAAEKQWYEYLTYSPQAVSSFRVDDERRLLFYDPYDYASSMIMKITEDESTWSSANSITISYTSGKTISETCSESVNTNLSIQIQAGIDQNYSHSEGSSSSATKSWSRQEGDSSTMGTSLKNATKISLGKPALGIGVDNTTEFGYSDSETHSSSTSVGGQNVEGITSSTTSGWSVVADRVTSSMGSSFSTNRSWSTSESKTVSRTFNAGYFNANGAPLQWKIVHYVVYMPVKYALQCKIDGEWVTTDESYCILTTIEGACRAYMKNTQAYIEHWGTGEPVIWGDFWNGFFSESELIAAYQGKLYPDNI
jgi:hypothetical protein